MGIFVYRGGVRVAIGSQSLAKRADTLQRVGPIVISNSSVASRMGQAATEKLAVRALS